MTPAAGRPDGERAQTTDTVLMVRPHAPGANPETAESNAFQHEMPLKCDVRSRVLAEFDAAAGALQDAGVRVLVLEDTPEPVKPDAVFPNNWFSTHADGSLVLYPMLAPSRRSERRPDALRALLEHEGRRIQRTLDLSAHEQNGAYLEGTGSLVLDRANRVAYAARSPRTAESVLRKWCDQLGYRAVVFESRDSAGVPIYHTNVMMWVGCELAGVALETVRRTEAGALESALRDAGKRVVPLSVKQIGSFAGNMLELRGTRGPVLAMSGSAWSSLDRAQRATIEQHTRPCVLEIPTIERVGGGSARCMIAEVFLPKGR